MSPAPIYRCTACRHTSGRVNWSDATHLDWEGNVIDLHVPVCTSCGSPCRRLPALSAALIDVTRGVAA